MSATPPPAMEGTHAPSPFEQLWDRYRSLITVVIVAVFLALFGQLGWKWYSEQQANEKWTAFAASLGSAGDYSDFASLNRSLTEKLAEVDLGALEQNFAGAEGGQKPYYLLAIARKAMIDGNWDRAGKALDDLEQGYPKHVLVRSSKYPVQYREEKEPEDPTKRRTKMEFEPAVEGSAVAMMRAQIDEARTFQMPEAFKKPEIPANAPKVKFTFGDYGQVTIALMPQAPKHTEAFLKLAKDGYWTGTAVDEVQRGTEAFDMPDQLHFGYESSKDEDRTKWTTTEPSEHILDWEETGLSHFEGAVAARAEAEGKSCANRLWVCVDDNARFDNQRVVLGFVTEGLEVLREICQADMSAQEQERGMGRPSENIRVTAVEVLE